MMQEATGTGLPSESVGTRDGTVPVLVAEIAGWRFGIGVRDVIEVQPAAAVTVLPGAPPVIEGVLDLRGELIAVLSGRERLGAGPRPVRLTDRFVVIRTAARTMAVRVDAVVALSDVELVDLEREASLAPDVLQGAGLVRLDDGLLVIQDVDTFLSAEESVDLGLALDRCLDR